MTDAERLSNQEQVIMSLRLKNAEADRRIAYLLMQNRTMQHSIDALRRKLARHDPERLFQ